MVPPRPGRGWRWPLQGLAQRSTDRESIRGVEPINRGGLAPLLLMCPPRPCFVGGAESLDAARLRTEGSCCSSAPQSPGMSKDRAPQRGDGHARWAGAGGGQVVGRVQAPALPPGILPRLQFSGRRTPWAQPSPQLQSEKNEARSQERWLLRGRRACVTRCTTRGVPRARGGAGVVLQPSLRQAALGAASAKPSFSSGKGLASLVRPAPGAGLDRGLEGPR